MTIIRQINKINDILYRIIDSLGLLLFYLVIVSIFQSIEIAFLNLRSLWYLIFHLSIGFGIEVGLIACCSHYILNITSIVGLPGIALFLATYQKEFLGIGILSNIIGIGIILNYKRKMKGGKDKNEK